MRAPRSHPRFYTPREVARLMGFPDTFRIDKHGKGTTQATIYHELGNAVVPPVITAIARAMLAAMGIAA